MNNLKSKWAPLISLLGFISLESTADGSYLQNDHIDTISNELASNKQAIDVLTEEKTSMSTEIESLKSQLSTAQQSVTDLTTKNTSLDAEVTRLTEVVARQPENNKELGKTGEEGIESSFNIEQSAGWADAQKDLRKRI